MRLRRKLVVGGAMALALLLVTGLTTRGGGAEDADEPSATATARVVRADLVSRRVVDGTLGYLEVDGGLVARAPGRVTGLRAEGDVVAPGQPLYALDGEPVLLLAGDRQITRDLVLGTRGSDVARLNATFGIEGEVFTAATADALRTIQRKAGGMPTGILRAHAAVVLDGATRVGAREVLDGADVQPGDVLAALAIDELVVLADLDAGDRSTVSPGEDVVVELPSGDEVRATIRSVASVASGDPASTDAAGGEAGPDVQTVEVVISLADPSAADGLTGAAVDVSITDATAEDVLAVPVTALVALAEGGYGVEVLEAGHRRLVAVEVGLFSDADHLVEVKGDLHDGDQVVVPA